MENKANILLLGTSGAGKSTLINTVIGAPVAKVGCGGHGTETMTDYENNDLNFRLIDSRGFEYNQQNTKKAVKDIKTWMKDGLKDEKPRIHMLWFCVDATSKRFTKNSIKTLELVKKEWHEVPIIVVLTKSFFAAEDEDNIKMVEHTFLKFAKKTGMPIAVVPVLAQPPKGEDIPPRGIEELIAVTMEHLDEAVRASEEAVGRYDIKYKHQSALRYTGLATASAAVVGAVPIAFPDSTILIPTETALITKITKIYGMDQSDDQTKQLILHLVEAGGAGLVAKAVLNKLKLIPGFANLAADVLNAIVAGAIVFAIGESTTIIMEKIYTGEFDPKKYDWMDKIVNDKLGQTVLNATSAISEKLGKEDGKLTVKDVANALSNLAPRKGIAKTE